MNNWSEEILRKIENREELRKKDFDMLRCILAAHEAYEQKLREVIGLGKERG